MEELALVSQIGTSDLSQLARLAPGWAGPAWVVALFLPVAALLSFALVGAELRGRAIRAVLVVLIALALSWLSAAWWVPAPLSNPLAYLAVAAVAEVMLVAYGVSSAVTGLGREAFGMRQIMTAMLAVVIGGGLLLQSIAALVGGWAVGGPEQVPAAWSVLESTAKGDFRVLWVGSHTNDPSPRPVATPRDWPRRVGPPCVTGSPVATVRSRSTSRVPRSARAPITSGTRSTRSSRGRPATGGALLAPFGVRFVIAADDDVPAQAQALLDAQVDLDLVPAAGLVVYRNARAISPAAVLEDDPLSIEAMRSSDPPDVVARVSLRRGSPSRAGDGGLGRRRGLGTGLRLDGVPGCLAAGGLRGRALHGLRLGDRFETRRAPVAVRYGSQLPATIQTWLLGLVWAVALWVTRKPVAR